MNLNLRIVGVASALMIGSSAFAQSGPLKPYTLTLPDSAVKVQMLPVPAGTVKIGTKSVAVKPFYMASTETTWEMFDLFLLSGPPSKAYDQTKFAPDAIARPSKSYILPDLGWGHHGYPVISVSYTNVDMFCRWLSSMTKKKYRVPTEAEWELACRDGGTADVKMDKTLAEKFAWYAGNAKDTTHPVGKKAPSKLGFFDLFGNVGEWATDMSGKEVLCGGTFLDQLTDLSPKTRKYWQPAWQDTDPQIPKSRWWLSDGPFVGFRLVCEAK